MITITPNASTPLYQQIYEQIRDKILTGEYRKDTRLTSTRDLAKQLSVGRNTVENAYAQLALEGYVISKRGSGHVVLDVVNEDLTSVPQQMRTIDSESPSAFVDCSPPSESNNFLYDFQCFNLDHRNFPFSLWRKLTAETLSSLELQEISVYQDRQGSLELRKEIMRYLRESRGVYCSPEQIFLCCGTQHSLDIICNILPDQKQTVGMEEPGYDGARFVFNSNGYTSIPIPVTKNGLSVDALEQSETKLTYTTPSHQFPTGVVMPIQHRTSLLQWAVKNDAVIIEDDYDSEFRYHSRPIPSLQSIDRYGRVIYLGTFSRSLAPGLRMSYFILPQWLLPCYHKRYARYHSTVSWMQQHIMTLFMARGHWKRHLRKSCLASRKRYETLLRAIDTHMGDKVKIHSHGAGLHILLELKSKDSRQLISNALKHNIRIYPITPYWQNSHQCPNDTVLLGFSKMTEEELDKAISIVAKLL